MTDLLDVAWEVFRWAWGIPVFALLWWLTRNLRQDPEETPEPNWTSRPLWFPLERLDRVSLAIVAGIGVCFWVGRNSIDPIPPDSLYHLLVARRISELGYVPMWDDWQFAPLGRPHLYPPLFHLLLVGVAKVFGGDFIAAFRWTESVALPFTFFTTWYLARWLFDARRAFAALLIVGTDYALVFTAAMGTPSVLSTSLLSIMLVLFLSGRWWLAAPLGVIAAYTHLGIPPIALGALGLFSLLHRRYLPAFLSLAAIMLLAALPWYARIYVFRDWFTHPLEEGVYGHIPAAWLPIYKMAWLQFVSLTMLVLVLRAFRGLRWHEQRTQILFAVVLASLPMLFGYGGRFYTHTLHVWSILAAGIFTPYLRAPVSAKRILAFGLLAIAPSAGVMGTGTPIPPGVYPFPSAWWLSPTIAIGALRWINEAQPPGYVTWQKGEAVAARIDATTDPDAILRFDNDRDFALIVQWLAHRRIDTGAWEETQPDRSKRALIKWAVANDPRTCQVSRFDLSYAADAKVERIGDLYIAHSKSAAKSQKPDKSEKKAKKKAAKTDAKDSPAE